MGGGRGGGGGTGVVGGGGWTAKGSNEVSPGLHRPLAGSTLQGSRVVAR